MALALLTISINSDELTARLYCNSSAARTALS